MATKQPVNETTEMWREIHRDQKEARAERRSRNAEDILALRNDGFEVVELTEYHFRVNGIVDFFPTNRRFHVLKANRRGFYKSAREFMKKGVR
jgi:hypothetical protein